MQPTLLLNVRQKFKGISWVTIFFSLIAPPALPVSLLSERYKFAIIMLKQSVKIMTGAIVRQFRQILNDLFKRP